MRQMSNDQRMKEWVVDYSAARARAIAWLGNRYLLATPVKRRHGSVAATTGVSARDSSPQSQAA